MPSWKTSLCGAIAMLATAIASTYPSQSAIWLAISAIANALGLMFARDNGVSDKQVGVDSPTTTVSTTTFVPSVTATTTTEEKPT